MFSLSKSVSKLKALPKNKPNEDKKTTNGLVTKKELQNVTNGPKVKSKSKSRGASRGVVMITNIPFGFYEKQMFEYFSQFGKVLRIRISKNKKTGKRRNYGFIEFEFEEVAKIAAQTMDNYLMFDHILKCKLIPKEKLKQMPKLFKNWNKEFVSSTLIHKSLHNRSKSIEKEWTLTRNRLKKVRQMETHLKESGLEFKCEVINLPDISKLRQDMKKAAEEVAKNAINEIKSAKRTAQSIVKRTEKLSEELKPKRSIERMKVRPKRRLFPKTAKFSIILSANRKRFRTSKNISK